MHWLQHSSLKIARAWRLKMALPEVCARAAASNDAQLARADLSAWLSWAKRCRLEPFKKLARTITERAEAVVRGMIDNRSNAFVEAMNGSLQQAKRAARGLRTASNFIAAARRTTARLCSAATSRDPSPSVRRLSPRPLPKTKVERGMTTRLSSPFGYGRRRFKSLRNIEA